MREEELKVRSSRIISPIFALYPYTIEAFQDATGLGRVGMTCTIQCLRGRTKVGHFVWEFPPQVPGFNSATLA